MPIDEVLLYLSTQSYEEQMDVLFSWRRPDVPEVLHLIHTPCQVLSVGPIPARNPFWHPMLTYLACTCHLQNDWVEALHTAARVGASQGRMSANYLPEHVLTTASIGFGRPHKQELGPDVPNIEIPEQLQRLLLLMMPSKVLALPDPETALLMSRRRSREVAHGTDAVITALEEMHRSAFTLLSCAGGHQRHLEQGREEGANLEWNALCRDAAAASRRRLTQAGARDGSATCTIPMNLFCPESPFNASQRPAKAPFTRVPVWLIMEAEHTGSILEAGCQALAATLQLPCYLIVRQRHMSQEVRGSIFPGCLVFQQHT